MLADFLIQNREKINSLSPDPCSVHHLSGGLASLSKLELPIFLSASVQNASLDLSLCLVTSVRNPVTLSNRLNLYRDRIEGEKNKSKNHFASFVFRVQLPLICAWVCFWDSLKILVSLNHITARRSSFPKAAWFDNNEIWQMPHNSLSKTNPPVPSLLSLLSLSFVPHKCGRFLKIQISLEC